MGSIANEAVTIPVIDISDANIEAPKQLLDAACKFGFVFVANNEAGISTDLIAKLFDVSRDFFALPTETKQEVSIASNKAGKNHGWLSQGVEKLDPATQQRPDVKEAFNMSLPSPDGTYEQALPTLIQYNTSTIEDFQFACHNLCQHLLTHFATALQIEKDWFTIRHDFRSTQKSHGSIFRLLYYPALDSALHDSVDIRAGAHSDYGSLTCLFQLPGQPGLEILTPKGEWAPVPVDPLGDGNLPILVNIGDLMQDWTGGLLKSTKHRVVFPISGVEGKGGDRYSIAYFCHPLDDAILEPVPSDVVKRHMAKHGAEDGAKNGRTITARDHLMERLAATYIVKG
ncbi:hypothetical protein DOTSEDRAFT_166229 [Dothistroma septosporum NZE10]|uniref:Fe2OG dioxygenase domain-containing protein n=1 Tax=Dothistroma septosporum (strain NZE10 / CBS 128990) TaxID=675120 RepID=N1PWE3_DOTSN|nr:hypothetical protein DOTSEDRAFT_166229 [Dothistroma septosporum NZE10]